MRVLETDSSISYKMGKNKKHRIRKAKENEAEDSSEDGMQVGCSHVPKAVNLAAMRKAVLKPTVTFGECTGCAKDGPKSTDRDLFGGLIEGPAAAAEGEDAEPVETSVCICLQCGHQGCDRNSLNKHALKHYKTPHSGIHCIIVNLTTWSTWCYACDDEVPVNSRIQGCIDFLQKQSGMDKPEPLHFPGRQPESPVAEAASLPVNNSTAKNSPPVSCVKVKGLSNLGNTCFFNAVMQSVCQTRGLESLLLERGKQGRLSTIPGPELSVDSDTSSSEDERDDEVAEKIKSLPSIQTVFGDPGPITLALLNFVLEMKGATTRNGTVNPTVLFTQVCKKAPRFKGFQQQDSHELLRYLIDCIRMEEVKRGQASILKFFKLPETVSPKKVDEETKAKVKEYGRQVKHTFLDSLFGGQLVSTVKCEECKNVSQIYESFLDLSLPVMEEKPQRPNLVLIGKKKDSMSLADAAEDIGAVATAAAGMGLEMYSERPNKYQERKNKRAAKKDAKKKSRLTKSKSIEQHESGGGKQEVEDKNGPDPDGASEDGNKNAIEKEKSEAECKPEKDAAASQMPEDLMTSSSFTASRQNGDSSPVIMDSSPEGSKGGLDANEEEMSTNRDDPSDADIEDNLESDMSRLDISVTANAPYTHTKEIRNHEESNIKNPEGFPIKDENSLVKDSLDKEKCNVECNHRPVVEGHGDTKTEKEIDTLCAEVQNLELSQVNKESAPQFSCQVSVDNYNSVDITDRTVENDNSVTTQAKECPQVRESETVKSEETDAQVSVSFCISLPPESPSAAKDEEKNQSHETGASNVKDQENVHGEDACVKQEAEAAPVQERKSSAVKSHQEYLKEARHHSMSTLSPRYQPAPKECSILSCLNQFTAAELLTGSNKFGCKECTRKKWKNAPPQKEKKGKETVYSNANKQYLIFRPPAVLTLHLKRFEQTGLTSRKVNRHVDFPLLFDLAPYCSSLCLGVKEGQSKVLYSLYGVVEHSGRLTGGHYTAYIKIRPGVGPHTQFLHSQPPSVMDLLNVYMERVVKLKDGSQISAEGASETMDKDFEARAEALAPPGRWFHISDSRVNEVAEAVVLKAQAYLLFYERIF